MWKVSEEPEDVRKHGDELQADTSASLKAETHKLFDKEPWARVPSTVLQTEGGESSAGLPPEI